MPFYELTLSLRPRSGTDSVELCLTGPELTSQRWSVRPHEDLVAALERTEAGYLPLSAGLQETPASFGRQLYDWANGDERLLETQLAPAWASGDFVLLRVLAERGLPAGLDQLPWEVLHDGSDFLIERHDFLPYRGVEETQRSRPVERLERAPQLLFMACSPKNSSNSRLSYEAEEAAIVEAINRGGRSPKVRLVVEETGNLDQLREVLSDAEDPFDIVHLSGHAGFKQGQPVFLTEDDYGEECQSTPNDIRKALRANVRSPLLVFLSGCSTGRGLSSGYSMAAEVVGQRIPFVLAWAKPVTDGHATRVAARVYEELTRKVSLAEAVRSVLLEELDKERQQAASGQPGRSEWHLLRPYFACAPDIFVSQRNFRVANPNPEDNFLDPTTKKRKVPTRADFVGRRRTIQRALGYLRAAQDDALGVVFQGAGGVGKTSVASRLLARLSSKSYPVVIDGVLDELKLLSAFSEVLSPAATKVLNEPNVPLARRLAKACALETAEREDGHYPLFVLDDFEQNFLHDAEGELILEDGRPARLTPAATTALDALAEAAEAEFRTAGPYPRIIVTCRYALPARYERPLPQISLSRFQDNERSRMEENKFRLLGGRATDDNRRRVATMAEGNPRLLENLLRVVNHTDLDLDQLEKDLDKVRKDQRLDLLTQRIIEHQSPSFLSVLDLLSIYRYPVTVDDVVALTDGALSIEEFLRHGRNIGLVEETERDGRPVYLVRPDVREVREFPEPTEEQAAMAARRLDEYDQQIRHVVVELEAEIVRLGLIAKAEELTARLADRISTRFYDQNAYELAFKAVELPLKTFPENIYLLRSFARPVWRLGKVDLARDALEKALDLCVIQQVKPETEAKTAYFLAQMLTQQGEYDRALQTNERLLKLYEDTDSKHNIGVTLHAMADIYLLQGQLEPARAYYERSLAIDKELNNRWGVSVTNYALADLYARLDQPDRALELFQDSLAVTLELKDERGIGAILHAMASVYVRQEKYEEAKKLYEQSLQIKLKQKDLREISMTLSMLGPLNGAMGHLEEAHQQLQHAFFLAAKIKIHEQESILKSLLRVWTTRISESHGPEAANATIEFVNDLPTWDLDAIQRYGLERGYVPLLPIDGPEED